MLMKYRSGIRVFKMYKIFKIQYFIHEKKKYTHVVKHIYNIRIIIILQ